MERTPKNCNECDYYHTNLNYCVLYGMHPTKEQRADRYCCKSYLRKNFYADVRFGDEE